MKWLRTLILFDQGGLVNSLDWQKLHESYKRAIVSIEHPIGSGQLLLRCKAPGQDGKVKRNGVRYLRDSFLYHMRNTERWSVEHRVNLSRSRQQSPIRLYPSLESYCEPITSDFGNFDFVTIASGGTKIAIEWETGNISSSHRSMNKLAIALGSGIIQVGVLIVPSRRLYEHLTDRIGNIGELSGYLSMWESLKASVTQGLLAITVVEHDMLTDDWNLSFLPSGSDGLAH